MNIHRSQGALNKLMSRLLEEKVGSVLLVEGKRDRMSVEALGFGIPVFECARDYRKTVSTVSALGYETIIPLFDLDSKGHSLFSVVSDEARSRGMKVNELHRRELGRILRLKYFEDLQSRIERFHGITAMDRFLEVEPYGKDIHRHCKVHDLRKGRYWRLGGETGRGGSGFWPDRGPDW